MTIGNFTSFLGTLGNDPLVNSFFANNNNNNLQARNLDIIYGLQGDDNLTTENTNFTSDDLAILVGGSGDDQYLVNSNSTVVIFDNDSNSSSNDNLVTNSIGINGEFLTIDGNRHLYIFDQSTDTYLLLLDYQNPENQIESFTDNTGTFTFANFISEVNTAINQGNSNFLGDFTFEQVQNDPSIPASARLDLEAAGLSPETINDDIQEIVDTANNFESTITELSSGVVNESLSNTDSSYSFNDETFLFDYYSLPIDGQIDRGDLVNINVTSAEFDPVLFILDSRGNVLDVANDINSDTSAKLNFVVGSGEPLFISVEGLAGNSLGEYDISVNVSDGTTSGLDGSSNSIEIFDELAPGANFQESLTTDDLMLDDGSFVDIYSLTTVADGQSITINLEADFDGILSVVALDDTLTPNPNLGTSSNVNLGSEQVMFTVDAEFDYFVSVTGFDAMELGDYTLEIV